MNTYMLTLATVSAAMGALGSDDVFIQTACLACIYCAGVIAGVLWMLQ